MINQPIPLDQLQVIGYADVLPEGKGPAVEPPVFRHRSEINRCFVPPHRVAGNWLVDHRYLTFAEVKELAGEARITLPEGVDWPARADHMLWVDLNGELHYQPASVAKRNLQRLFQAQLSLAIAALRQGKIDEAESYAGTALAAQDRSLEPRALMAVCHALKGEEKQLLFLRKAAEAANNYPDSFNVLVKSYLEFVPVVAWESVSFQRIVDVCQVLGIEVRRPFILPDEIVQFLEPILTQASFIRRKNGTEIRCYGLDASFLIEFQLHFKQNVLSKVSAGQAIEVVRKSFYNARPRQCRLSPTAHSIDECFAKLGDILVDRGVLLFMKSAPLRR